MTLRRVPRPRGQGSSPHRRRPFGLARVHGDSMLPTLRADDRLLVRYGAPVAAGRLVLARFADGTLAVKRATRVMPMYQFVLAMVLAIYVGFSRLHHLRFLKREP